MHASMRTDPNERTTRIMVGHSPLSLHILRATSCLQANRPVGKLSAWLKGIVSLVLSSSRPLELHDRGALSPCCGIGRPRYRALGHHSAFEGLVPNCWALCVEGEIRSAVVGRPDHSIPRRRSNRRSGGPGATGIGRCRAAGSLTNGPRCCVIWVGELQTFAPVRSCSWSKR